MEPKAWLLWGSLGCIVFAAYDTFGSADLSIGESVILFLAESTTMSIGWAILVLLIWSMNFVRDRTPGQDTPQSS